MSDVTCTECGTLIDESGNIVSGKGVWCSIDCWEAWHGQPWVYGNAEGQR